MLILEEAEALGSILLAIFDVVSYSVRNVGVQIGDRGGSEIDGQACPVVAVPVDGDHEVAVCQGGAVGELVSPAGEPAFDEIEGVVEPGSGRSGGGWEFSDELRPDEGA